MTRTVMTTTVSGHWAAGDSKAGVRMMENVEGKAYYIGENNGRKTVLRWSSEAGVEVVVLVDTEIHTLHASGSQGIMHA